MTPPTHLQIWHIPSPRHGNSWHTSPRTQWWVGAGCVPAPGCEAAPGLHQAGRQGRSAPPTPPTLGLLARSSPEGGLASAHTPSTEGKTWMGEAMKTHSLTDWLIGCLLRLTEWLEWFDAEEGSSKLKNTTFIKIIIQESNEIMSTVYSKILQNRKWIN